MEHLTRDEQVLLHYGEPLPAERRAHAAACDLCRRQSDVLRRVLEAVIDEDEPLPESWEETFWRRLRWKLQGRRDRRPWYAAAGIAAAIVLAFFLGRQLPRQTPVETAGIGDEGRARILLVVLNDHLTRSERVLTEVKNATSAEPPLSSRKSIEELLIKNRLYRDAALAAGETSLASILEEMEPLLMELARAPAEPTARDLESLQRRIEKKGLLFKLRVAGDETRRQSL
jgi:hypothetical protein